MTHPIHTADNFDDYMARLMDQAYYIELQDAMEARGGPLSFDDCLELAGAVPF